jgi:hypothetical protein
MNTTLAPFTGDALVERAGRTFVLGIASTSRNAWRNSRAARDPTAHCRGAARYGTSSDRTQCRLAPRATQNPTGKASRTNPIGTVVAEKLVGG